LIAVIPRDSPPDYLLKADGSPGGFAIEVMELIARRAGIKVRYQIEDNWNQTLAALREGRADMIPNLGIIEARRKDFAYTAPLETFRISVFVRRDTNTIRGLQDLGGQRVAVVRDNAAETLLKLRTDIRLESFPDFPDALFALLSGNVDALAYPEPWAWKRARAAHLMDKIKVVGEPLIELKRALAVRADNRELLARLEPAVKDVLASTEYRETYTRWIATPEPYWTLARLGWIAALLLTLTIIAMAGWRFWSTARAYRALKAVQEEQNRTEARRQTIFETAAASLWEEDITEVRRLIESHRAEVFSGWHSFFDARPELVADFVRVLRVLDVNTATLRLYEADSKEQLLASIDKIFADESYDVFKNELVAIAEGRSQFTAEAVNRTLRGKKINVLLSASIPPADSPSQRMVVAVLDFTERKQAEAALQNTTERFRQALRTAHAGAWEWNIVTNEVIWSEENYAVLGLQSKIDHPTFETWLGCVHPEDRERSVREINQAVESGSDLNLEFRIVWPDGDVRWISDVGRTVFDQSGKPALMYGIQIDITERKQVQLEREKLVVELTARNAEMESFVYTISHDLKAPLITIDGFANLLAKDLERNDRERGRESIGEIRKATVGMQHLIEDLLMLSRTGQIQGEPEDVDLNTLLKDIQARCASHIEREHATVRIDSPLPRLHVDRARFGEVLQNLLDNAVKFHREKTAPEVKIGAEQNNGECRLYVHDNGIGIEKRYQDKIFGLFQRLDTNREGTGVGLTIARRIVEQLGGRLWVESEPGRGSTFWISFPDSVMVDGDARVAAGEIPSPR
ncbi:MAG: transporter substrate-binding domain-containing protein, partial [Sulfuricaulis sp.]|nr:transporter substrate-binding domain-containing protein [Sulfuricaulis sp.]